jgi:hypothetical protein
MMNLRRIIAATPAVRDNQKPRIVYLKQRKNIIAPAINNIRIICVKILPLI